MIKIQKSNMAEWADYLGLFFLILMGAAISFSIAATNILAGVVLLCFSLSGQYSKRWHSIIHTPYARMSLLFFAFLCVSMLMGYLIDDVPFKEGLGRLLSYKKVLFVVVMVGLLSTCRDHRIQKSCFVALLVGAVLNLFAILGSNLMQGHWAVSVHGVADAAIFSNSTATGFILCTLFWCSGVIWLHTENARGYWFSLALLSAVFLINVNVNRTSMVIFPFMMLGLFLLALKMHRVKQEGRPWGLWLRLIALLMMAIYLGIFFQGKVSLQSEDDRRGKFKNIVGQMDVSMDSLHKASQGNFETSIGTRLKFYQNALPIIAQDPVLGCGVGCVRYKYAEAYQNKPGELMTENLHSEYVNLLVQTGIIGLFIFLLWISSFWKSELVSFPYAGKFRIGMIVIFLMFCLVNSSLMDFHEGWMFCYFTSLCVAPKKDRAA